MDDDLLQMTPEELAQEVLKLRKGIRAHRDAKGNNLCWWVPELWGLLPERHKTDPQPPQWLEFIRKCAEYRASLDAPQLYCSAMTDQTKPSDEAYEEYQIKNYRDMCPGLNELADTVWQTARGLGFHDVPVPMSESCSNLHSEVSELWESYRNRTLHQPCDKSEKMKEAGLPPLTNLEEELADIVIRALDTAREHGVDISTAVAVKNLYNARRPHRNGNKAA